MSESNLVQESATSDESHKTSSSASSQSIPVIPPRPKSKNRAKSSTSLVSNSSGKSSEQDGNASTPSLKDDDKGKSEEPELELLDAYSATGAEEHAVPPPQSNDVLGTSSSLHDSNSIERPPHASEVEDSQMNYQTNDQDTTDGDKTPGNSNTKASFKEDIDEENGMDEDTSSFNDDMETVLQESHDSSDEASNHSDHVAALTQDVLEEGLPRMSTDHSREKDADDGSKEEQAVATESGDETIYASKGDEDDHAERVEQEKLPMNKEEEPHVDPIEENEQGSENKLVTEKTHIPVIPARPVRKSVPRRSSSINDEDAKAAKEPSLDVAEKEPQNVSSNEISKTQSNVESADQDKEETSSRKATVETNAEQLQGKPSIPKIPTRPTKKLTDSKVPPKAPPPKPKKLSSKIEAFQQQLFNSASNQGSSSSKSPEAGPTNEGDGTPKHTPVHRKMFESSGIPLPGMFNPALRPMSREPKEAPRDESRSDAKPTRRVRGPKGKRLPQAVAKANVVSESNRVLEKGKLWSFAFTKSNHEEEEEEEEEEKGEESEKDDGKISTDAKIASDDIDIESIHESEEATTVDSNIPVVDELLDSEVTDIKLKREERSSPLLETPNTVVDLNLKDDALDNDT